MDFPAHSSAPSNLLPWSRWAVAGVIVLASVACHRPAPPSSPPPAQSPMTAAAASPTSAGSLPDFEVDAVSILEGEANWYDVPANSLAQRRAWPGELTAASDRIAPETYVRVRRVDAKGDPQKSVVVRITDHDVGHKNVIVDLDREAAEALGMVKAGQVRVRVETLALKNATTDKPVASKTEGTLTPKASEITDQPTATRQQEKAAAAAKTSSPAGQ